MKKIKLKLGEFLDRQDNNQMVKKKAATVKIHKRSLLCSPNMEETKHNNIHALCKIQKGSGQ